MTSEVAPDSQGMPPDAAAEEMQPQSEEQPTAEPPQEVPPEGAPEGDSVNANEELASEDKDKNDAKETDNANGSSDDDDDEDDVKVTIEDYDFRAAQKQQPQSQQPKQPTIDFEASQAALDVDINTLEDKPWRKPGADLNDYFNYGFDESTWRMYCDRQKKMKAAVNELVDVQETHKIPVLSDFNKPHGYQLPIVAPIMVQPSMGVPPPPHLQRDLGDMNMRGDNRMSSHRRSRSPPPKSSRGDNRHHSRAKDLKERKRSRSRESSHRRERERGGGKESRKRRSRSREREDERHKSKRHKSSRRA